MSNIYESITAAMQEGYAISKDSFNQQQKFKYRGIDAVMNVFQPILSRHKIFLVPEVLEERREERVSKNGGNLIYTVLRVRYTFYAEDGTFISAVVIGEGMDSADKSANKAMAVAMKYCMFQIFCIPTEDMADPDADSYCVEPRETKREPVICEGCGNEIEATNGCSVTAIVNRSMERFGRKLCFHCAVSEDLREKGADIET